MCTYLRFICCVILVPTSIMLCIIANPHGFAWPAPDILWQIRIPHVLTTFVMGSILALAGALMQALTRNPLADPYLLGVSGGAAAGALLSMLCFGEAFSVLGSWIGAMFATGIGFYLCLRSEQYLLLNGIALASGFSALISIVLLLSPDQTLRGILFWLMGDIETTHWPWFAGTILVVGFCMCYPLALALNIFVRGEQVALSLGVSVATLKGVLFLVSSLLTATVVSQCGCIGFIGLIIPHCVRLLWGYDHRQVLPLCVLVGGTFLTLVDGLARYSFYPQMVPVGLVMTLIGIPLFIVLLQVKTP